MEAIRTAADPESALKKTDDPATGALFRIKRYALHDGPGIRTTVFLKGCPLRCAWCHNPEGIDPAAGCGAAPGGNRLDGWRATAGEVVSAVERDLLFYDRSGGGVTFSGGEPLAQPEFLAALLRHCRQREIHTALDTSGYCDRQTFEELAGLADAVLFDLKLMDAVRHRRQTGASNRRILANLDRLATQGPPVQIRVPLVPGVTDTEDNLDAMIAFLAARPRLKRVALLPFHRTAAAKYRRLDMTNPLAELHPPGPDRVAAVRARFESAGLTVGVGG